MASGYLITGPPGVGKTTVLLKVIQAVKAEGFRVGGMVCREVRVGRVRVGFKVEDLATGRQGWLAHRDFKTSVRVGRYGVNLRDLESIGVEALKRALKDPGIHIIALDEIGPMELKSRLFRDIVLEIVGGPKPLVAVVHYRARDALIDRVKSLRTLKVVRVSIMNRDRLPVEIAGELVKLLKGGGG